MIINIINKKLNNFYILYYVIVLFKSIFILILKRKFNNYLYKIYNILIIYLKLYYIINNKRDKKYIFNNKNVNFIYFYIYKYNNNIKLNNSIIKLNNNIIEKIIEIKKISYTIKKGRIKRYKIVLVLGNKQGWIGLGVSKNININKAIISAKIKALNNIYYFKYSILNIYKLRYIYINYSKFFIKLQFKIYNYLNIRFLLLKYLFECLGYFNCKIIIYYNIIHNRYNLLNKLLLILFNIF
ncbi:rps5 (apicoplast) [Plasmodium falciparum IGH-CR14]|uniref:Apicoplast ribosomal protein S5 n=3 Tax=Plasmodium falciparum TaxID=5833 RepID=A0A140KXW0_PLAF7|nr:apicoplast ribosomal protein S5 [Plasmodium falciparum NF54]KNZ35473.1 rps5 [Plasmodium falciparum IGH-CR14]VWP78946.1 apicoplast ribosomal protein S5 [Plasmodium falciparum 3D7]|eukprot:YP_009455718.1 apicoplast ribosomal protein S5 (apicoplast) [Plasmodium falciparum 3D7]